MEPDRHYYEMAGQRTEKVHLAWWEYSEWDLPNGVLRKTSNCGAEWFRYEVIIGDNYYKVTAEVAEIILSCSLGEN